ncbi:uncharacterized protein LOC144628902 [Oculina patagonica]
MEKKSERCCLGLTPLNPNISGELAQVMMRNQELYVPTIKLPNDQEVHVETIFFDGDALTEERARNVQWMFKDGDNKLDRLEGLDPLHTDWHTKLKLYELDFKLFFKRESASDVGSMCASMNRSGKTNAKQGPKVDYNAYKDFHDREFEAHVLASFMTFVGMKTIEEDPSKLSIPDQWQSKQEKKAWFDEVISNYLAHYVVDSSDVPAVVEQVERLNQNAAGRYPCRAPNCDKTYAYHSGRVRHETSTHPELLLPDTGPNDEMDSEGYYRCRGVCGLVYKTKATRNNHEKKKHPNLEIQDVPQEEEIPPIASSQDYIFNYHKAKLCHGFVLADFNDAIREGDGERVISLYKILLLIFKTHHCIKYAYATLLLLVRICALLSESQAFRLKWNRFCNATGKKARNIPLDLRLEHDNNFVKAFLKALGSNLNESNAQRVAACLNYMLLIMGTVDEDCERQSRTGTVRGGKDPAETVKQITTDLMKGNVFTECQQRNGYTGFENFSSNLYSKLDYRQLFHWIKDRLKVWEKIYE